MDAQGLCRALNGHAKAPQFTYSKARATARADAKVDWPRTRAFNADFNPEVDGCESFVMSDGSVCMWMPTSQSYVARPPGAR